MENQPSTSKVGTKSPAFYTSQGNASKLEEMLRKQRSNFKAFSRTISIIDLDKISEKWEFEDILQSVQSRWSTIDSLHWEIDSELFEPNEEYEESFSKYEQHYLDIKKSLNSKMWSVSHREKSTPTMDIPTFNGNYHQWIAFKDLFTESIHTNRSISCAQKMQFLKAKLRGEPERLIQHLHISTENYKACWDILNHRYNNTKLIFSSHINILLSLPTMQQQSASQIKKLYDTTNECLNAVKNLGVDISTWDPFIVHVLALKLDQQTHSDYTDSLKKPRDLPILSEFLGFLEKKFTSLEASRRKQDGQKSDNNPRQEPNSKKHLYKYSRSFSNHSAIKKQWKCPVCGEHHRIFNCKTFLESTPDSKRKTVDKLNLCRNCLYDHNGKACISQKRCTECNAAHNSILHQSFHNNYNTSSKVATDANNSKSDPSPQLRRTSHVSLQHDIPEVLLPTAILKVQTCDGTFVNMRALIDQGSQTSLITEHAAQVLGLPRVRCHGVISGVGAKESNCKGALSIKCVATISNFEFETEVYIMKNVIKRLPNYSFSKPDWTYLDNITLADPEFNISRPVDLLLGADIYSLILLEGICRAGNNVPIAQNTRLGWILTGNVKTLQCNVIINDLEEIHKFWEIEDISEESTLSLDDQQCIDYYHSTTIRREDGRYEVRLPLAPDFSDKLGESKPKAIAQFKSLENKFKKHENIKIQYKSFINEYCALGHMIPATGNPKQGRHCVLTHHCVRADDTIMNSKFRVVFNASCKTSSGFSLNDVMRRGPNLQQDLQSLIIKWRQYQFAFTADIEKMFRQIWIHPDDQQLLKIVWRDSPSETIKEFQLTTVTYGTKAAPFLSMMTLKQLAHDEKNNYQDSNAINVLKDSFYMDDLVHGCHNIEEAMKLQHELIRLLKSGGFHLRKWKSNAKDLLQDEESTQISEGTFNFKQSENTKTLGLGWNPQEDVFTFQSTLKPTGEVQKITKRNLLSDISKLFDPLGWLSPISTKLKIIFQQVWAEGINWDDPIPNKIYQEWLKIREDMNNIQHIKLPRWINASEGESIELHGFSDSSLKAYACVIYCRVNKGEKSSVVLLIGKTRLVPTSKKVTLPRLELSGALLLSKLMEKVKKCLGNPNIKIYGWVDSMVVLGWLNGDPARWKTFVANRVRKITECMPSKCWRYVKSEENPADSASRGMLASQLKEHSLWWQGPTWLSTFNDKEISVKYSTNQELKLSKQVHTVTQQQPNPNIIQDLLSKFSNYNKVVRVVAWICRFISKTKKPQNEFLSVEELKQANLLIIKNIQQLSFEKEVSELQRKDKIHRKSKICELYPYLDQDGILRVGGRLRHANLDPDMRNPIIIPPNSRLAELLINQAHQLTYHGGARLTSAYLRQKYWIVGGNRAIKKLLRGCITCRKQKPTQHHQIMGDLPTARANPSRPFYHVGVDYTGHVFLKANSGRGIKTTKGYVAVFTCMATKAVHLELVSDLTSTAFLAALRRMAARRGKPRHIYSDNATNFVGANKILQQEYEEMLKVFDSEFYLNVAEMGITWHFNAPSWPSANGLCEAAVKSLKFHLKRVIGEQKLTFEEFTTLLAQLEACLNSRPLCPINEDPEDLNYLTPSHFLSSGPILSIYETEKDLRTRWYLTQKIFKDVWKRWQKEYLTNLSARGKWRLPQDNIKLNDVVIINDGNLPAGRWALGRVVELHPGQDGFVRVVTLKTKNGYIKRPVVKLSIIPVHPEKIYNDETPTDQKTNNANKPKTKHGIRKYNFATVASSILLFFMTVITNTYGLYTINKLENNTSLFFDKVVNMHLRADDWKLVVFYDLNPYWEGTAASKKYMEYLETICSKIKEHSHCDGVMYQLRHEQSELQRYNIMLQDKGDVRMRKRRGLINGVGNIANALFGVLDNNFAEKYEKDIELIRRNQEHLAQLWKNQTSVVEAEFNVIKRVESIMEKQHKTVNKKMLELELAMNNVILDNSYINEFTLTAIITNNIFNKLKELQTYLIDTVTDVFHGKYDIHLLTPEQLQHELSSIITRIPKDLLLPTDHANYSNLYKLLNVKARLTKSYLIFEIRIPLVARDSYEVLKVTPIPRQLGSNMISIVPISDYLAINLNKDSFMSLSFSDLHDCIERDLDTVLCRFKKPIYHMINDKSLCEKNEESGSCKTIIKTCKNMFIATSKHNNYFYFCCNKCYFKLICEDQVTAIQLSDAGLITMKQSCLIKSSDFRFYAYKQDASQINAKPDIEIPKIAPINHLFNISLPENASTSMESINQQQLFAIQQKLDRMKETEPLAAGVSYHDIHHYTVLYLVMVMAGVVGGVCAWRRARRSRRRAGRDRGQNQCSEVQCVDVELHQVATQCSSGHQNELRDNFMKQKQNRSTSPVLQSVFTIADTAI